MPDQQGEVISTSSAQQLEKNHHHPQGDVSPQCPRLELSRRLEVTSSCKNACTHHGQLCQERYSAALNCALRMCPRAFHGIGQQQSPKICVSLNGSTCFVNQSRSTKERRQTPRLGTRKEAFPVFERSEALHSSSSMLSFSLILFDLPSTPQWAHA